MIKTFDDNRQKNYCTYSKCEHCGEIKQKIMRLIIDDKEVRICRGCKNKLMKNDNFKTNV